MLSVSNLRAGYSDLEVLRGVTMSLEDGKIGVVMGPNGAGKSTLLKAIMGINNVTGGETTFNGTPIRGVPTHKLLSHGIAYVTQGKINFGSLTVEENLRIGARHVKDDVARNNNLDETYDRFPALAERKQELAYRLSGGQQQMLAIGRALLSLGSTGESSESDHALHDEHAHETNTKTPTKKSSKLLLLDEPSLGLSPKFVKEVFASIHAISQATGISVLIVEHNIRSILHIVDICYVMVQGQVVQSGTADQLAKSDVLSKIFVGEFE